MKFDEFCKKDKITKSLLVDQRLVCYYLSQQGSADSTVRVYLSDITTLPMISKSLTAKRNVQHKMTVTTKKFKPAFSVCDTMADHP